MDDLDNLCINGGTRTPKWTVYSRKYYKKMDDLGVPLGVDTILSAWL